MNDDLKQQVASLTQRLDALETKESQDIMSHTHDGNGTVRVDMTYLEGLFETVSTAPTNVPQTIFDQVKFYKNGATIRLYFYDANNKAWRYAAFT